MAQVELYSLPECAVGFCKVFVAMMACVMVGTMMVVMAVSRHSVCRSSSIQV